MLGLGGGGASCASGVVAGRFRVVESAARSRLISGTVSGIIPGSDGGGWSGVFGGGGLGVGAVSEVGGGDGADGQGGHDQYGVAGDRGVEPGLALVEAEAVLAELEVLLDRPAQPGGADQPGHGHRLALGHVAVVEGQLAAA